MPKVPGPTEPLKRCNGCKTTKARSEFYPRKKGSKYVASFCKGCLQNDKKKWTDTNYARVLEYNNSKRRERIAKWDLGFIIGLKLASSREIAKRKGHEPCTTPPEEIIPHYTTVCRICLKDVGKRICLDHCHTTGKFRGFLCTNCNFILGNCYDSIDLLHKVIEYLKSQN